MEDFGHNDLEPPVPPRSSLLMPTWPKVDTDYHGAVVRVVTTRIAKKQYLLFGYVELYPRDIPVPKAFNVGDKPWSVPGHGGNATLAASAWSMSVADALIWYEKAAHGQVTFPSNVSIELVAPPFGVEPSLGRFSVGEEFPVTVPWHGDLRIHRLIPMQDSDHAVTDLASSIAAREWLVTNVGLDPFEYEDWLASISLLAPDPLLDKVVQFNLESAGEGNKRVALQVQRRRYDGYPAADVDALIIVRFLKRSSGWTEVEPCVLDVDGFVIATLPEPDSMTGYAVTCPSRGLLRMQTPVGSIGPWNLNFRLPRDKLEVEVPSGGHRKPSKHYQTTRFDQMTDILIGEAPPLSAGPRLRHLRIFRENRIQEEKVPQKLFGVHDADKDDLTGEQLATRRHEAEDYVASLVAKANNRVIFVDPDFGVREFQNYTLRVERLDVEVTVLTGAPHMRKASSYEEVDATEIDTPPPGVQLLHQLDHVKSKLDRATLQVLVMAGSKKPIFHDRFLVVDNVVWALGPSFNELGERIGLISKVHEPRIVIAAIQREVEKATDLAEWVANSGLTANTGNDDAGLADV